MYSMKVEGTLNVKVQYGNQTKKLMLAIVKGNGPSQEFIIYIVRESIQRCITLSKGTALQCYAIFSIRLRRKRPVDWC